MTSSKVTCLVFRRLMLLRNYFLKPFPALFRYMNLLFLILFVGSFGIIHQLNLAQRWMHFGPCISFQHDIHVRQYFNLTGNRQLIKYKRNYIAYLIEMYQLGVLTRNHTYSIYILFFIAPLRFNHALTIAASHCSIRFESSEKSFIFFSPRNSNSNSFFLKNNSTLYPN